MMEHEAFSAKIGGEWKKFGELSGVLVGKQGLSLKQWGKIYQPWCWPTFLVLLRNVGTYCCE